MIDLLLVLAFVTYALWSGFAARKDASQGPEEYFLAGRRIPGWKAGLSMAATQYAADTPLVVTGLIATAGVFALWRFWVYSIAFLLMGFLLAPAWRRALILTDAELCERRYSGRAAELLRYVKAIYFGTVINCVVLAMVLLAATRITEPFLTWHLWLPDGMLDPLAAAAEWVGTPVTVNVGAPEVWLLSASNLVSIFLIVAFTTLYSATGGLRSVINTDVVQLFIALLATFAYAWAVTQEIGGLGAIGSRLESLYGTERAAEMLSFSPTEGTAGALSVLAILGLQWIAQANSDGTGYLAQRSMACRSEGDAQRAAVVFTYTQSLLRTLLWLPIVVGLMVLYPATGEITGTAVAEREATFVLGIRDHLPPGALGLMLVGMLAALASTVDTHLNWGAGYWTNDLYDRLYCQRIRGYKADPRRLVWIARLSNFVILVIALAIMSRLSSIQEAWTTSLLFGAGMGIPLLLRWFWHRQNGWGELAPIAISMVAAPALLYALPEPGDEAVRMVAMTLIATLASVAASLLTPAVDAERLDDFYRSIRPPGAWSAIATRCGEAPAAPARLFWVGLAATFVAAGSVFALIVGLGSWLVGSPTPFGLPAGVWRAGWIVVGVALIPVWRRLQTTLPVP